MAYDGYCIALGKTSTELSAWHIWVGLDMGSIAKMAVLF